MNYAYTRRGGPLFSWANGIPPRQYRGAEATALGCDCKPSPTGSYVAVGDPFRPGSPEALGAAMDTGTKAAILGGVALVAYLVLGRKR